MCVCILYCCNIPQTTQNKKYVSKLKRIQLSGWRTECDDTQIGQLLYYLTGVQLRHLRLYMANEVRCLLPVVGFFMAERMVRYLWFLWYTITIFLLLDHTCCCSTEARTRQRVAAPTPAGKHRAYCSWRSNYSIKADPQLSGHGTSSHLVSF